MIELVKSAVMQAAEANEASAALPRNLHHDLSRPNSWASALERANNIENYADRSMMDAVSATNPMYPQNVRDAGRSDRRLDMKNFRCLDPPVGALHRHFDPRAVGDRTLSEIAKHVRMQQNIRAALIGDDEAKSFYRIKPLYLTEYVVGLFLVLCQLGFHWSSCVSPRVNCFKGTSKRKSLQTVFCVRIPFM